LRFRPPGGLPSLVYIIALPERSIARAFSSVALSRPSPEIELALSFAEVGVEGVEHRVLLAASNLKRGQRSLPLEKSYSGSASKLDSLVAEKPISIFTIRVGWAHGLEEARLLLKSHLKDANRSLKSLGVAHECLLATLEDRDSLSPSQPLVRELIVIPYSHDFEEAVHEFWRLCEDLATLASYAGRLYKLKLDRNLILMQIDSSEKSTQMRINEIFVDIRRPMEELGLEGLEGVLREVTTLFSNLSILASVMRRDYVKAQSLLRRITSLYESLSEAPLGHYPTNSSVETSYYESLVAPFKDFIERVNALRVQLDTVLNAVRTYLGIQRQKLGIEEQASSRDLLARLVSLQEILHKLEILIVAFYITEMGKLVFEAVAPRESGILTVAFIPLALLISTAIQRLLHRNERVSVDRD